MSEFPGKMPEASIIIVTYNSRAVIGDCLESLVEADLQGVEIIVVDNASRDDTPALVTRKYPRVQLISNEENIGFAKAVNIGVLRSRGEFIVLLNPDATLSREVLASLIKEARSADEIGVIAPLLGDPNGRLRVASAGRDPSAWRMFCHFSGLSRALGSFGVFEGHYLFSRHLSVSRSVDFVSGACMVIPRRVWDCVGGMTERWFMYAEDLEFCYRAREHGYRVVLDPELKATHLVGESSSGSRRSADPAWVINLYDFFATDIARSIASRSAWRLIVSSGLLSRSGVYRVESVLNRHDREMWAWESKRFTKFAVAALQAHKRLIIRNSRSDSITCSRQSQAVERNRTGFDGGSHSTEG